ncbi:DUF742 domain-containing protein [Amycolatopsis nigrescens]|uniref:DUF742 domain-containing protein n=1 Tax=Amycolatopsis nigrescens TaxID=381445 RepID=UPI00037991BF|nr:DUF742 domain-containing protein [Amycolatopsis nigrescens]
MSTGSGFFGEEPGADRRAPGTGPGSAAGDEDDGTFADVLNGFTLNSGRARRKRKKDAAAKVGEDNESHAEPAGPQPPAEPPRPYQPAEHWTEAVTPPHAPAADVPVNALFDPSPPRYTDRPPPQRGISRVDDVEPPSPAEETAVVRPYALTGGRTKSNYALELETLVSTRENIENAAGSLPPAVAEQIELRSIVEECRTPRSVAELVAYLRIPLGVVRVLISDAADAGLVAVHKTISGNDGAEAHLMLMERVLSGLRRL